VEGSAVLFRFPHRIVILSEAPHRLVALHSACGAESKDLGDAYSTHAARSFSATEAEDVDVSAGHSKMLASSWVLGSREKPWGPPVRAPWLKSSEQHG
jgi:hypothetical protein